MEGIDGVAVFEGVNVQRKADAMEDVSGAPGQAKLPWQPRPVGSADIVWRYDGNPVLGRRPLPNVLGIYNSAVAPFEDRFVGVFRTEDLTRFPRLHVGWSSDAIDWQIEPNQIEFESHVDKGLTDPAVAIADYAYDPRVCWIDDRYYVTWCGGHNGPTISIASTSDFRTFHRLENAFLPFNRNGVLFPRRINGQFVMLSRPSDDGHTPFGDIYVSRSPDMCHWGQHRLVMGAGGDKHGVWWQRTKIGAGPIPIETDEGWLMIFHAVMDTCNGFVYQMGSALLDLEEPDRVIARCSRVLLGPEADYEVFGHVPNVIFPVAALCDPTQDQLAIYYGAADTSTCLAYAHLSELVEYTKTHSVLF